MPEVIRAKKMGFCFGVKGAVGLAEDIQKEDIAGDIYMLGMIVHNEHVIEKLSAKGIKILNEKDLLEDKDPLKPEDAVIIRAHGTTKDVYEKLTARGVKIYDAACDFVTTIRKTLEEKETKGYKILFVGDRNHPEVRGIISFGKDVEVVADIDELKAIKIEDDKRYALLTQTTLNKDKFEKIKKYTETNFNNVEIFDKICGATAVRQRAVKELAEKVDVLLVIGGKNSSNTRKLYEISNKINKNTYLIQDERSLDRSWYSAAKTVGITAGASTPEEIIEKIENIIRGTI